MGGDANQLRPRCRKAQVKNTMASTDPVQDERPVAVGSGYGGTVTPADDFVAMKRKTCWANRSNPQRLPPPRVYLDHETLIREVCDVADLRHGDHCLTSLNPIRIIHPSIDYLISLVGNLELAYLFHHFIVLDDVAYLDEMGVPRTADDKLVRIVEYTNTPCEALAELKVLCRGDPLRLLRASWHFLFNKASCQASALAEYGDTPHIYRVIEQHTPEDRERIVRSAIEFTQTSKPYRVLTNNCEHTAYAIRSGSGKSHNVSFLSWMVFRLALCCVGLFFLQDVASACYTRLCVRYPFGALLAYHVFTSVPVLLQELVSYAILWQSVWRQYRDALIDHDDCYHLLAKELGRVVVVGGLTILTIALMPRMIRDTQHFVLACFLCALAYWTCDLIYNALAQGFMRLILVPIFGKVWLIGSNETKYGKAAMDPSIVVSCASAANDGFNEASSTTDESGGDAISSSSFDEDAD